MMTPNKNELGVRMGCSECCRPIIAMLHGASRCQGVYSAERTPAGALDRRRRAEC